MSNLKLNQNVRGAACWEDGGKIVVAKNTLTHKAGDIIANALSRNGPYQISHLYLRFNGPLTLSALARSDLRDVAREDFLAVATISGGFYVPLLTAPAVSSSNTDLYTGNKLTYYFRIPSGVNAADNGLTNAAGFNINTSRISAMGLAVAKVASDRSQDIIFSAIQGAASGGSFNMFQLVDNGQKAIDYPVTISFT